MKTIIINAILKEKYKKEEELKQAHELEKLEMKTKAADLIKTDVTEHTSMLKRTDALINQNPSM